MIHKIEVLFIDAVVKAFFFIINFLGYLDIAKYLYENGVNINA